MPRPKGIPKTGGRKAGVIPQNMAVRERLRQWGFDPFEVLHFIASGDLKCGVCHGTGKTKYQPAKGENADLVRKCQSCYGSGKERVAPAERSKAASELAKYCEPQLKAIEHTGSGGGPILTAIEVVMVRAEDGKRKE